MIVPDAEVANLLTRTPSPRLCEWKDKSCIIDAQSSSGKSRFSPSPKGFKETFHLGETELESFTSSGGTSNRTLLGVKVSLLYRSTPY